MYQRNPNKRPLVSRRRLFIAAGVCVVLVGAIAFAVARVDKPNQPKTQTSTSTPTPAPSPESTESDKNAGDTIKDSITTPSATPTPTPNPQSAKKAVTPIIISASGSEVRGFVPGVVETGGSCTLTLTKSGQATITNTQPASPNATTTDCQPFALDTSVSGWSATIKYSSNTSEGTSAAMVVQ